MIVQPRAVYGPTPLANASATLYTVPASQQVVLTSVVVTNVAAAIRVVTINIGRGGAAAAAGNVLVDAQAVNVYQALGLDALRGLVLDAGDVVYGHSDAATSVNITISGYVTAQ